MEYTKEEVKIIQRLRQFFTISVAVFDMQNTVHSALGYKIPKSYMHSLHLEALEEVNKIDPDLDKMKQYLENL